MRVATHAPLRGFVEQFGLEFFPLGGDPEVLAQFAVQSKGGPSAALGFNFACSFNLFVCPGPHACACKLCSLVQRFPALPMAATAVLRMDDRRKIVYCVYLHAGNLPVLPWLQGCSRAGWGR